MSASNTIHELETLVRSHHSVLVIETVEEDRARDFLVVVGSDLRQPVYAWSVTRGLHRVEDPGSPAEGTTEPRQLLGHLQRKTEEAIYLLKDMHVHLTDPVVQRQFRDVADWFRQTRATLVLTGVGIDLPPAIEADALRLTLALPGRDELEGVVSVVLRSTGTAPPDPPLMAALLESLRGLTLNQARQAVAALTLDHVLDQDDVRDVLERKVRRFAAGGLLEFRPAEDNRVELAGMTRLKEWLDRAAVSYTEAARDLNLSPPRGILLVGVPGCGKSEAARYVARLWQRPLLKLDAARLYDKYVGESERNLRHAIEIAESMAPIVLWIDEIEKGLAAGGSDDGAAVSHRLLGTFLTWLQEKSEDIFLVATANDLSLLPPELSRKGRFDEVFFVDLPTDGARAEIFSVHLARRRQHPTDYDLDLLVGESAGFSGSEIEAAVVAGLLRALQNGEAPGTGHVLDELRATVPLSRSRDGEVAAIRAGARAFVPAG